MLQIDMNTPLSHIILTLSTPIIVLASKCQAPGEEAATINFNVLGIKNCPANVRKSHYVSTFHDRCLQVITSHKSWNEAREDCQIRGGDLVTITNQEKQSFIISLLINHNAKTWIGANDKAEEGQWRWVSGKLINGQFDKFGSREGTGHITGGLSSAKSEDCALIDRSKWKDYPCNGERGFFFGGAATFQYICEYDQIKITTVSYTAQSNNTRSDVIIYQRSTRMIHKPTYIIPRTTTTQKLTTIGSTTTTKPTTIASTTRTAKKQTTIGAITSTTKQSTSIGSETRTTHKPTPIGSITITTSSTTTTTNKPTSISSETKTTHKTKKSTSIGPETRTTHKPTTIDSITRTTSSTTKTTNAPIYIGSETKTTHKATNFGSTTRPTNILKTIGSSTKTTNKTTPIGSEASTTHKISNIGSTTRTTNKTTTSGSETKPTHKTTTIASIIRTTNKPTTIGSRTSSTDRSTYICSETRTRHKTTTIGSTTRFTNKPTTIGSETKTTHTTTTIGSTTRFTNKSTIIGSTTSTTNKPAYIGSKTRTTLKPTTTGSKTRTTNKPITIGSKTRTTNKPITIGSKTRTTNKPITIGSKTRTTNKPITIGSKTRTTNKPITIGSKTRTTNKPITIGSKTRTTNKPITIGSKTRTTNKPTTIGSETTTTHKTTIIGSTTKTTNKPTSTGSETKTTHKTINIGSKTTTTNKTPTINSTFASTNKPITNSPSTITAHKPKAVSSITKTHKPATTLSTITTAYNKTTTTATSATSIHITSIPTKYQEATNSRTAKNTLKEITSKSLQSTTTNEPSNQSHFIVSTFSSSKSSTSPKLHLLTELSIKTTASNGYTGKANITSTVPSKTNPNFDGAKSNLHNVNNDSEGMKAWCIETEGKYVDFSSVSPEELNLKLRKFYAEAQPMNIEKRERQMPAAHAREYHKNTLKNVRSALNRHIQDIERGFDIVRDAKFKTANNILDAKLKFNMREGLSRPTQHKEIISPVDLQKISSYLFSDDNPVLLRYRVWYFLGIHFVTRGIEFHKQLTLNSFQFQFDENNKEYATIVHETKQKNRQGGVDNVEAASDKRMYATNDEFCPVAALKLLINKTDPDAQSLFNHCSKNALLSPQNEHIWYTQKSVKEYQFSRFMPEISKNAGCCKTYVAHCLRATSIQHMNDTGFELRHIMFMSGHRNESSVRSYNRYCSNNQKRRISATLSSMTNARDLNDSGSNEYNAQCGDLVPTVSGPTSVWNTDRTDTCSSNFNFPLQSINSNSMSSGFISNSSFNNCTFQFSNSN